MELTKTLYVKVEHEGEPEDDFLITSSDPSDLSESGSTIQVGVYELVRKVNLTNQTIVEEI